MSEPPRHKAEIVREYGPYEGAEVVHGVTFDGRDVWFAHGERLQALDPASGQPGRALLVCADAGSAFDGQHLYQLAGGVIQKLEPRTGEVLATIPSPAGADSAGLTWAEGSLWVASYRARTILELDPRTGEVLRRIPSTRFVTGVTFMDGELWHGTWEDDESELRRVDVRDGRVLEALAMPESALVSGLEAGRDGVLYAGGARSGKIRAVRRSRGA